jgi:hypothetical protein
MSGVLELAAQASGFVSMMVFVSITLGQKRG